MAFPTTINNQIADAIAARRAQLTQLHGEIVALERAAGILGAALFFDEADALFGKRGSLPTTTKTGRTPMTAAARKAVSVRMKASWARRKKATSAPTATGQPAPKTTAKATPATRTGRKPLSAAARKLLSEKLKAYWATRKRARR